MEQVLTKPLNDLAESNLITQASPVTGNCNTDCCLLQPLTVENNTMFGNMTGLFPKIVLPEPIAQNQNQNQRNCHVQEYIATYI